MDPNLTPSLSDLFSEAVEIVDPGARRAYLDRACGGQAELRRRVDALLAADERAPALPATGLANSAFEVVQGQRLGRYTLLELLGEGGCGTVYRAEQSDPVQRQVALKLIKPGMDTRQVIARFEGEQQALARMDHPHIARVLDAGATEGGRPYFVMELVRGLPITRYCDSQRLTLRARLDLFIKVCHAVQHAHQKGVIHRDLKPTNILVTEIDGVPTPKIIDFGIAKAVEGRLSGVTLVTGVHQLLGTPAYMSPEQVTRSGADIDTRSDIYSLGILLFELLTGRPPFDAKALLTVGLEALGRTIREQLPPRPSSLLRSLPESEAEPVAHARQIELPRLLKLLRGDLDAIVLKCVEKEPDRRYATAHGLALDLGRHLSGDRVLARPTRFLDDLRRGVSRHRTGFTIGTLVFAALSLLATLSTTAYLREQALRRSLAARAYLEAIRVAHAEVREGRLGDARSRLRSQLPLPGEPDLRGWEWRRLVEECREDPHLSLEGHRHRISNVRFLDHHRLLTTERGGKRTFIWDLASRQVLNIWTNHASGGGASSILTVTTDGTRAFYRPAWGTSPLCLLNLETGAENCELGRFAAEPSIRGAHVSPDGLLLAVAGYEVTELWETVHFQRLATMAPAGNAVRFSPDGRVLAVATPTGDLRFWEVEAKAWGHTLTNLHGSGQVIGAIRYSADGRWLATAAVDGSLRVRRVDAEGDSRTLPQAHGINDLSLSHDGSQLAVAERGSSPLLYDLTSALPPRRLRGHTDEVLSVDFSPDGAWLATASRNGEVFAWRLEEARRDTEWVPFAQEADFTFVAPDGSGFVRIFSGAGSASDTVEFWSAPNLRLLRRRAVPKLPDRAPSRFALLAGANRLAVGYGDGTLQLIGVSEDEDQLLPRNQRGQIFDIASSLEGSAFAVIASAESGVRLELWRWPGPIAVASTNYAQGPWVALSVPRQSLVTLDGYGGLGFHDLPLLTHPQRLADFGPAESFAAAYTWDGASLAVACEDGTGAIYDVPARTLRTRLPPMGHHVRSASFSRDGHRLALDSDDQVILVDVETGETLWSVGVADLHETTANFSGELDDLLVVGSRGVRVFRSPPFRELDFDWLRSPADHPSPRRE